MTGQINNVTYAPNIFMTLQLSSAAPQPQHPMSEGKHGGKLPDTRPVLKPHPELEEGLTELTSGCSSLQTGPHMLQMRLSGTDQTSVL